MYCFRDTVTTTKGDALVGWQIECVQNGDLATPVTIYADENLTPIATATGVANRAVSDSDGNFFFFVEDGIYGLRFYDSEGVYQRTKRFYSMYGTGYIPAANLDADGSLAANSDAKVASQKAVKTYADTKAATATLEAASGSFGVGFIQAGTGAVARTVQAKARDTLHASDFGVVGDGLANDTAALQLAINASAAQGKTLLLPGSIRHGAVTVPANTHIMGIGGKTSVTAISGSYNLYTITGSNTKIENLAINDSAKSGGWDFIIACGTNTLRYIDLNNITTFLSFGVLTDSGTGTDQAGSHIILRVRDVLSSGHRGPGLQMTRGYAYQFFERVSIDYVTVSTSNFIAYDFNPTGMGGAAGGMTFIDCTTTGTCGTFNNANQHGWRIQNTAAVWMLRCSADTSAGSGMILDNVNGIKMTDCWFSLCGGDGITMTTVYNSLFSGLQVYGRNYLTPNGSGTDGCRIVSGCFNLNFIGCTFSSFGRHGFNKSAGQVGPVRLTGCFFNSNGLSGTGYGLNSIGNSALHAVSCGFGSNQQGNANLQGTFDYLGMAQLNSGVGNYNAGPGPVTV